MRGPPVTRHVRKPSGLFPDMTAADYCDIMSRPDDPVYGPDYPGYTGSPLDPVPPVAPRFACKRCRASGTS